MTEITIQSQSFIEWYNSQPVKDLLKTKKKIITKCHLPINATYNRCFIFENWLSGKTKVPHLAQKEINKIAEKILHF